ncbi:hypothetical protein N7465_004794 [Penicillium sp. CMV-2018d]|nr:hypothetical protein N7465_004794 [Penicillium sp. CMV-2018d]
MGTSLPVYFMDTPGLEISALPQTSSQSS